MKIVNRKAYHEYQILKDFTAGIQLIGSEVKSLREGNANLTDAYIFVQDGEVYLKNSFIAKYKDSSYLNHEEKRDRKLLLNKREIRELIREVKNTGITIIPFELFLLNGKFKVKMAIVKGKKLWDKRESIKEKDLKRSQQRENF